MRSRFESAALFLAIVCALAAAAAGFGHRFGWWSFSTGFSILRWSVAGALISAVLSLARIFPPGGRERLIWMIPALIIALATAAMPLVWLQIARRVPPIHDITTDTDHPPAFVAILPLRRGSPNSAEYGGAEIAVRQHKAYPDLKPLMLDVSVDRAFRAALDVARELGWRVIAAGPHEGRIEATDTTFWFRFTDDVVVRITPQDGSSRVDVRSVSRVGRSDVGTNARRIRRFLHALRARIP